MNRVVTMLLITLIFMVVISVYFGMSTTMNTTGMPTIIVSSVQQYLPLLALVGVIIAVVSMIAVSGKKG